jgi:hypothetical protein
MHDGDFLGCFEQSIHVSPGNGPNHAAPGRKNRRTYGQRGMEL